MRIASHRLIDLNDWFPVGGLLGRIRRLEEVCHWEWVLTNSRPRLLIIPKPMKHYEIINSALLRG